MLDAAIEVAGKLSKRVHLDAGYKNKPELGLLNAIGIAGYVELVARRRNAQ